VFLAIFRPKLDSIIPVPVPRDVQNSFLFWFSLWKKNWNSVWNEFRSVRFKKSGLVQSW